ncbi:MAG: hypothetical protein GC203_02135 [Phenylobacterium sp.]|uniref:hypothetical protein n=1 Tax=Phenylobacterium sp. TaxID=1871053 RepID=UPI0025E831CC|nr:hypothetical protein [Phenylobacterium sp.]MBI1196644.1 hypothetical protein [Phenylobacterium sp.]
MAIAAAIATAGATRAQPAEPPEAAPQAPEAAPAPAFRCAPAKLVHIVTRNISPGLAASDRAAQPRELWRRDAFFLRSQESADPTTGAQPLVIISEPDIWVINLANREGRHAVDAGPELEVRAPILPPRGLPPSMRALEYGCEPEYVATFAPREERVVPWGGTRAALHSHSEGEHRVAILMDQRRNVPLMVSYLRAGKPVLVIRYDDYRNDLPDRPQLFIAPPNVKLTETGPAPTPLD